MWFGILGHLAVRRADGTDVPIPGPARRQLLAAMLSRPGGIVSTGALVEDLWGSAAPRSAISTLRSHVVRLRADLAQGGDDNLLVTVGDGYRLDVAATDVDAGRFEALVDEAGRAPDLTSAIERYDQALALWREEPYVEFGDAPFAVLERIRLTELRALARERRTDLALEAGATIELIADLEQRTHVEPYRERGWEQLALALYRAGRQAEALSACRRVRQMLVDDLGVDPSPGLQRLEERLLRQDPELLVSVPQRATAQIVLDRCPYLGLAGYEEQDAPLFVGRERLTSMLAGRLADHSVVVVTGASGVGKSSLVRAGLVPALRSGALPGSSAWRIEVSSPTDAAPLVPERSPDLLVLDQAEELFTRLDSAARDDSMLRLARYLEHDQGRLVLVLRSDFYGRLATLATVGPFAENPAILVGPMRADELRRALVEPAIRAGLRLEDELVETVMDDVAGQSEPLPLLSEAMVGTWERRNGDLLTLAGYEQAGELAGALETAAERCYGQLDDAEQRAARHLLVRMTTRAETAWVRRPLTRADLLGDAEQRALAELIDARLVIADERGVEIAHEALLAHWPRLRNWLDERRLAADMLDHLSAAATQWRATGRQDSDLYRGPRLSAALDWHGDHPADLSPAEEEFLTASQRLADADLQSARAQTRRLRTIALALAGVVVLAVAGGAVALVERGTARTQTQLARRAALIADARRLVALAADAPDTATSAQLALAAYRLRNTQETRSALLAAVERTHSALWRLQFSKRIFGVTATPNGSRVALDGGRGVVVIDPKTRTRLADFATPGDSVVGLTTDGRQVLAFQSVAGAKDAGDLWVQAVPSGRVVRLLSSAGDPGTRPVRSYSGRWFALVTRRHVANGAVVQVFDSRNWAAPPHEFVTAGPPAAMEASASALAVEHPDGSVEVRALPSLSRLGVLPALGPKPTPDSSYLVAVSPDGSLVARASLTDPAEITVYDLHRPHEATRLPLVPAGGAVDLHFSPDGTQLAVGANGGPLGVYRASDGVQIDSFVGNSGQLFQVAWAGETASSALYSVGLDGELISWDTTAGPRLLRESGPDFAGVHAALLTNVAVNGSHHVVAFGDPPGTSGTWRLAVDLRTGSITRWPIAARSGDVCCTSMTVSGDGRLALESVPVQNNATRNELWDLRTKKIIWQLPVPPPGGQEQLNAIISPDGTRAYVNLTRTRIGVYAVPSGNLVRTVTVQFAGADGSLVAAPWAVDPVGRLLVYRGENGPDNRLGLVDPISGKLLAQVSLGDIAQVMSMAWSNDRRLLAVGTFTGTVFILDAQTLAIRSQLNAAEPGTVRSISFSPDDQTLVTTGEAGQLDFWTVPALEPEVHLTIGDARVYAWYDEAGRLVGLAPDPKRPGKDMYRWLTFGSDEMSLATTACALAGNNITRAQWQRDVGDQPYRKVCR